MRSLGEPSYLMKIPRVIHHRNASLSRIPRVGFKSSQILLISARTIQLWNGLQNQKAGPLEDGKNYWERKCLWLAHAGQREREREKDCLFVFCNFLQWLVGTSRSIFTF